MGKPPTTIAREEGPQDTRSRASGEQIGQGVGGRTLPEWHEWIVQKNPQGRMGDFMVAMMGKPLDKRQRSHLTTLYKDYPGGVPAMMAAICFVAVKEPKGDPVLYLKQVTDKKRYGNRSSEPKEKGFSRDEYVES
jgi:hypothetical protein